MRQQASYFERVFGAAQTSYATTRRFLFGRCRFEDGPLGRERCFFGDEPVLDAGWFYTPSVRELHTEVAEAVAAFDQRHPGFLDRLRQQHTTTTTTTTATNKAATQSTHATAARLVTVSQALGESKLMHLAFPGALFQAASQFNLLEFICEDITPEAGIAGYAFDATQGPACAMACFPGTAYRNYLIHPRFFPKRGPTAAGDSETSAAVPGEQQRGQQEGHQVNMLSDVTERLTQAYPAVAASDAAHGEALPALPAIAAESLFTIRNGYFSARDSQRTALMTRVAELQKRMPRGSPLELARSLASALRIGIVEDTTVTAALESRHTQLGDGIVLHSVTQTFNSALSLAYPFREGDPSNAGVELLARSVLLGTYEATLLAGILHTLRQVEKAIPDSPSEQAGAALPALPPIFLTKVGGGVFNNRAEWIRDGIAHAVVAVDKYNVPLDVRLVHFGRIDPAYQDL